MQRKTILSLYRLANYFDRHNLIHYSNKIDRILQRLAQESKKPNILDVLAPGGGLFRDKTKTKTVQERDLKTDAELIEAMSNTLLHGLVLEFMPEEADALKELEHITKEPADWSKADRGKAVRLLKEELEEIKLEIYNTLPLEATKEESSITETHTNTTPLLSFQLWELYKRSSATLKKDWPKQLIHDIRRNKDAFLRRWQIARQRAMRNTESVYDTPVARPDDMSPAEEQLFDRLATILTQMWQKYQPHPQTYYSQTKPVGDTGKKIKIPGVEDDLKDGASGKYTNMTYIPALLDIPRTHQEDKGWQRTMPARAIKNMGQIITQMIEENRKGENWSSQRIQEDFQRLANDGVLISLTDYNKLMSPSATERGTEGKGYLEGEDKEEQKRPRVSNKMAKLKLFYYALLKENTQEALQLAQRADDLYTDLMTLYDKWEKADTEYQYVRSGEGKELSSEQAEYIKTRRDEMRETNSALSSAEAAAEELLAELETRKQSKSSAPMAPEVASPKFTQIANDIANYAAQIEAAVEQYGYQDAHDILVGIKQQARQIIQNIRNNPELRPTITKELKKFPVLLKVLADKSI